MTEASTILKAQLADLFCATHKRTRVVSIENSHRYRLLTVALYAGGIRLRKDVTGSQIGVDRLFRVRAGDFVFSKIDARNGAWGFVPQHLADGLVSGDFPILELDAARADADFLKFALGRPEAWEPLRHLARGTTNRRRIQVPEFLRISIPCPPLPEQRAIAAVLRTVQRAKEACEKVIAATCALKRSLLHHLFTYGPVPFDQADRVVLKETDYAQVPDSWQSSRLTNCAYVQTGVAKGRKLRTANLVELPYLRVANVQDGRLDLTEIKSITLHRDEVGRFLLQTGDVVLTEGGDFDKLGRGFIWYGQIERCVHQNHVFAVRPNRERLLPEFLAYLAQSIYGKAYFLSVAHKTTNLACINATKLKGFPILLPSLGEQEAICMHLSSVDAKLAAEEKRWMALDNLFQSLLHNLMTGRVRVNHLFDELVGADPRVGLVGGAHRGASLPGGTMPGGIDRTRDGGTHGGAPLRGGNYGTGTR